MKFLLLIVFEVFFVNSLADKRDSCAWKDHKGHRFDLSSLKKSSNYQVSDIDTSMGMFNMIYEFNFCTTGVKCQEREVAAFEALEVMGRVTDNCDALGLREAQSFSLIDSNTPEKGVQVSYGNGDMCFDIRDDKGLSQIMDDGSQMSMTPRSVTFQVTCSSINEDNFKVIDSSKCNIVLGIKHQAGCFAGTSSSSFSSTILYYLFWFSLLYFGGGAVYNMKKKDLKGIEAIPNIDKLRELPILVVNGVQYCISLILGLVRKNNPNNSQTRGSQGYATV